MSRYKPSLKYGASDKQRFVVYDKVFARMKGYPPWPAKIMPQKLEQKNVTMFSHCIVYFYGTKQLGECSFVDIYEYEPNKIRFQDVCQSSKSTKNAFEMALKEIAEDDGDRDDMSVDFVTEEIEFDAPICQLFASKQAKKLTGGKKRKHGGGGAGKGRGGGGEGVESQDEGVHTEEEEGGAGVERGRAKRGYDSQDDVEEYDSIPEDENTADDDDDNDDDFNMNNRGRRARSQSRSRSRTKRRRGGARRKAGGTANGPAPKKKATRSRKPVHPDSDPDNEDETSGMLSNDEDMSNVMVRTRNPAALLKECISKELDLHETNTQTVAKYEDAVANLLYRSNTITAELPDGSLVEFTIRPKSGAGSNVASGVGQGIGPTDLSAIQARVEEYENLKNLLESGGQIPPEYSTEVMTQLTPEHQTMLKAKREATLAFLEVEAKLLEQETILKQNLTMAKADFKPVLAAIDTIMKLDIRPLTLKKYPEVVNTFRKLQSYNVSVLKTRVAAPYQLTFENSAALVRNGADFVMEKFASLFEFSDEISFYEAFYHELVAFIEETRGVPVGDIMLLTD